MEREPEITYEDLREIAALRHSFHIDSRLRLEFLSVVSKLLREHEVPVSNRVLSTLILAVPDELPDGNGHQQNGYDAQFALKARSKSRPAPKPTKAGKGSPARPVPPVEPIPPPIEPIPPPIEPIPPPIEPIPPPIEPMPPAIPPVYPIAPKPPPPVPPMRKGRKR